MTNRINTASVMESKIGEGLLNNNDIASDKAIRKLLVLQNRAKCMFFVLAICF